MSPKKILFITPVIPLPPTGGGTRSFHILQALTALGETDLVCFQPLMPEEKERLHLFCKTIVSAPSTGAGKHYTSLSRKLVFLFPFFYSTQFLYDVTAYIINSKTKKEFPGLRFLVFNWLFFWLQLKQETALAMLHLNDKQTLFNQLLRDLPLTDYQVLAVDLSYLLPYFQKLTSAKFPQIIINAHNAEYDLFNQFARHQQGATEKKWMKWQATLIKDLETQSLANSSAVFCCSGTDRERFLQLDTGAKLFVIPNGVDDQYFKPTPSTGSKKTLLFTGTMNYAPNVDAVAWLIHDIFKPLQKLIPDVQLIIAGRNTDSLAIDNIPVGVQLVNSPEDIRPYFNEAAVVVVPLRQGSGTRLKILEAAAMKKPIVSTTLGAEGLEGLTPDMICLADTAENFIMGIQQLLQEPSKGDKMAQQIYTWVTHNYSWQVIKEQVKDIVSTL